MHIMHLIWISDIAKEVDNLGVADKKFNKNKKKTWRRLESEW